SRLSFFLHVILDQWDLQPGHDSNASMESMVRDPTVTKVLLISRTGAKAEPPGIRARHRRTF
ncbi:MAG: hypothetical protein ACREEJ_24015, partial [Ensifer adhaerens]